MQLKIIKKHYKLNFPGKFEPLVSIGTQVNVGSPLGVGDYYHVLQEIPLSAINDILVDDGVFITKGTALGRAISLLKEKIYTADKDGIVRITKSSIQIVDIQEGYEYTSPVKGRVLYAGPDYITIEAEFYEYWTLASLGNKVEGELNVLTGSGNIITSKNIPNNLNGQIVLVAGMLTWPVILKIINSGAIGILGASIDYSEYKRLKGIIKYINLGVILGFGQILMPDSLTAFFKHYEKKKIIADFSEEVLLFPVRELFAKPADIMAFSGSRWAVPIYNSVPKSLELDTPIEVKTQKRNIEGSFSVNVSELFSW